MNLLKKIAKSNVSYDVVFYYPQHFNRSANVTNPYYDPLIAICESKNLRYVVLEEPDKKTKYARNLKARKFDFWFYTIIILRKIIPQFIFSNESKKEVFIGKLVALLSLSSYSAKVYITISNSMIDVLLGFSKTASVFDLQHGIIYSWHSGYFDKDGLLNKRFHNSRIGFLVYGNGFKKVFFKKQSNADFINDDKVNVIGNLGKYLFQKSSYLSKNILFTLHLSEDESVEVLEIEKAKLLLFIESLENIFKVNGLTLLLKSHPRFNDFQFLNSITNKYSHTKLTDKNIPDLSRDVFLHITINSTSIFEFAQSGIISLIVPNELGEKIFIDEYQYPIVQKNLISMIEKYLIDSTLFQLDSKQVYDWSTIYYEPFNEDTFLTLFK